MEKMPAWTIVSSWFVVRSWQNCERRDIRFEGAARLLTVAGKAAINRMVTNTGETPVPTNRFVPEETEGLPQKRPELVTARRYT